MLAEFYHIANLFAPTNHDRSMTWAARNLRLRRPGPWITFLLIPLDPTVLGSNNARIPDPEPSQALDIDAWARLILHHGRPGMRNAFHRIIFDRAFRVSHRSVWRYLLGRIIAPLLTFNQKARGRVAREFAYLVAVPTAYIEAVVAFKEEHGPGHLRDPSCHDISIMRISAIVALDLNFRRSSIISCLLDNRIPVEWVTNAYLYGVQFIRQHIALGGGLQGEYQAVEDERVSHLHSEPVAYPPFDGWFHPSPSDLDCVHHLMHIEVSWKEYSRDSPWWIGVGDPLTPPLPTEEESPALQQPELSTSQDVDMDDRPGQTIGEQLEDLVATICIAAAPGVEGQPSILSSTGGSLVVPVQDVVMNVTTRDMGEQSPISLGSMGTPDASTT